jgi:ankyrin repeat protein
MEQTHEHTTIRDKDLELFDAVREGNEDKILRLLKMGASIHARNSQGQTPLHTAAFYGFYKLVDLFLRVGGDPEANDNNDETPLLTAIWQSRVSVVELLLTRKVKLDLRTKLGSTPLTLAAWRGQETIVKTLLDHGADIEAQNYYHETSLIRAASSGRPHIVDLLLQHHANTQAADLEGRTALHKACTNDIAELLIGASPELLKMQDNKGWTPWHSAVYNDRKDLLEVYLKYRIGLQEINKSGETPLDMAKKMGKLGLVQLLSSFLEATTGSVGPTWSVN